MSLRTIAGYPVLLLLAALSAGGCTAETQEADAEDTDVAALTAREGYTAIENTRGGVYVSVAVKGKRAYLGDNRAAIDVVDLKTMKKTKTLDGRIPSDSLSVSGNLLAACGERDDQPLGWDALYGASDRNYIITLMDATTGAKKMEISLRLQQYLQTGASGGFIDLPNMSCQIDATTNRISVGFAQNKLQDEVVSFDIPSSPISYDFRDIPGATRTKLGSDRNNTIIGFAESDRGITYAAGGYGVRRVSPGASTYETIRDEGREHMVGLVERGDHMFAANHDGALLVLDADSANLIESKPVDDWLEGLTVSGGYVIVVGRAGLFVTKDRWSR